MYKIYLSDNVLIIDSLSAANDYAEWHSDTNTDITKLLQKVQNSKKYVLLSADPDALYDKIASLFRIICAAGGLVTNSQGETLMIYRLDRWDLPKGKLEKGENIEQCAIREVEEECGVSGLLLQRKLTITSHLYFHKEQWIIKQTHWYKMTCLSDEALSPQTEEGITKVEWVSAPDEKLVNSYDTIRDVFSVLGEE